MTQTKVARTDALVLNLLREHQALGADGLPTTLRFLFYELEQGGLAEKPQPGDTRANRRRSIAGPGEPYGWPPGSQDVTDAATRLREAGLVPWNWLADTERSLSVFRHAPTVLDYLLDTLPLARINPWQPGLPPLILTESNGMALVLDNVAREYACPIAGTKGMSAGFLRTEIAPLVLGQRGHVHERDLGRHRDVLYLGDLDRSGLDIEANSKRVLLDMGWTGTWKRIGLLPKQTKGLTPIWKVDGRDKVGAAGYEVEALGQSAVVTLVRTTLDALLPEPLDRVHERTDEQRDEAEERLA